MAQSSPPKPMSTLSLDDKYTLRDGRIYISGVQALVRLLLEQRRRDRQQGLNTAGFVSGYRGSPLGGVDFELWRAAKLLEAEHIHFEPGLNEELAATMVQGSQQIDLIGGARYDGVIGLFYAKNPGLDRAGDALKHANAAGTARLGGVLAISGDDPAASSSSIPNQSDHAFMSAQIPTLAPANIAEMLEFGLQGYALSRYAGVWVGMKTVADVVEASASVLVSPAHPVIVLPEGQGLPADIGMRWPDSRWDQDQRLLELRLPAALAFARANRLDRVVFGASHKPRFGIVASGKAATDVRQALLELGIDQALAERLGLALYKVGMSWPLEPSAMRAFAEGLDEVLVIEERRAFVETQLKEQAYAWPQASRPRVVGKCDEQGVRLLADTGVLTPLLLAPVIARRLAAYGLPESVMLRLAALEASQGTGATAPVTSATPTRTPHFCAGCPHARSTRVPEGSIAMAGIGCHSLRLNMPEPRTLFLGQMGGEGANWLGAAPFVATPHLFQNLGDGTYTHSGTLAVRAAVAAKRAITFRILCNGAVAMTGGQPVEGTPSVGQIAQQLLAEGVARVVVVAEDTSRHAALPAGVTLHSREAMESVERELRANPGVTALIYDQLCAIEKRRRRKRGELPSIAARAFINERVCEGCGDCAEQSQCAAVMPVPTALGTKRRIDQSACNADMSCLLGFCPSFVTVYGGSLRKLPTPTLALAELPAPAPAPLGAACNIIVDGIGGTGVVTVGAILGMAAHLEGYGCSVLDNTGIARKGGAVSSHVRLAPRPADIETSRVMDGAANLVIAADLVVAAQPAALAKICKGVTRVVLNTDAVPTLNQRLDPNAKFDSGPLLRALAAATGEQGLLQLNAAEIAERLLGDKIYANMLMLGYAWQSGGVPLPLAALERAIEINATAVAANQRAFSLGRMAAHDPRAIAEAIAPHAVTSAAAETSLDQLVASRSRLLTAYQDAAYARRFEALVARVREAAASAQIAGDQLARAVALSYFRLLAIKDEYEVARLYSDGEFQRELASRFEGPYRLRYHLAPPLLAQRDPVSGHLKKSSYGAWIGWLMAPLAKLRFLRGTALDPFGYTQERRMERRLIVDYEQALARVIDRLRPDTHQLALEFAALPQTVRGFGHVKEKNAAQAARRAAELLAAIEA